MTTATTTTDQSTSPAASDPEAAGLLVGSLFERHAKMVYGLCRLLLRDGPEAEDATQQAFLSAYGSIVKGTVPEDGVAWLATIARNECHARLRRRKLETVPLADGDGATAGNDPARIAEQEAEVEALSRALAELPLTQRQAIVLREFYGLTYEEVATVLGVTEPSVESLLFRSRKKLQARLRPWRQAAGVLTLPIGLREALEAAIPHFGAGALTVGTTGAGSAVLAKLSVPGVAKLMAATLAVSTAGTVAAVDGSGPPNQRAPRDARIAAPKAAPARAQPPAAAAAPAPTPSTATPNAEEGRSRWEGADSRREGRDGPDGEGASGSRSASYEPEGPANQSGDAGGRGEHAPSTRSNEDTSGDDGAEQEGLGKDEQGLETDDSPSSGGSSDGEGGLASDSSNGEGGAPSEAPENETRRNEPEAAWPARNAESPAESDAGNAEVGDSSGSGSGSEGHAS